MDIYTLEQAAKEFVEINNLTVEPQLYISSFVLRFTILEDIDFMFSKNFEFKLLRIYNSNEMICLLIYAK